MGAPWRPHDVVWPTVMLLVPRVCSSLHSQLFTINRLRAASELLRYFGGASARLYRPRVLFLCQVFFLFTVVLIPDVQLVW